jgi:hypothetical protein
MAVVFSITTPAASVELAENRVGEVSFTVTNLSDSRLRARVRTVPGANTPPDWLTVEGDAERDFEPGAARQFTVRIEPPLGAPAGSYNFRLDAIGIEHPDDDYAEGPSCQATVPPSTMHLTVPRGYLTTILGALAGGIVGELIGVILVLTSNHNSSNCKGFGCVVGSSIGEFLALLFGLVAGFLLTLLGAALGAGLALRIRRYLGAKLTAGFLAVLLVPWAVAMLATVFRLMHSLVVIALLAPILLVAVPALVARGSVLLIRTHHI